MLYVQRRCGCPHLGSLALINKYFYTSMRIESHAPLRKLTCSGSANIPNVQQNFKKVCETSGKNRKKARHFLNCNLDSTEKLKTVYKPRQKVQGQSPYQSNGSPLKFRSARFRRYYFFREEDLKEKTTLGSGPGGQATNRRKQTVILKHIPSNIIIRFGRFPSLWCNRRAARELLDLRLEERLLGEKSRRGQQKIANERRRRRRQRQINTLLVKYSTPTCIKKTHYDYFSFLKGVSPLPPEAVAQIPPIYGVSVRKIYISTLLDVACNNWWSILQGSFDYVNASLVKNDVSGDEELMGSVSLPLVLKFLFPVAGDLSEGSCSFEENDLLQRCRSDREALKNVQQAFRCFCELFGLRLKELAPVNGSPRLSLAPDGINWIQLKSRMVSPTNARPSTFSKIVWPRVYFSLKTLKLNREAASIAIFFRGEIKRNDSKWAKEILQLMSEKIL